MTIFTTMVDSFFSYLVRVGVINTSQLSSLSIEPDEEDWITRRVVAELGWLAPKEICRIDNLMAEQPHITFLKAAEELGLLDIEQLTSIASHIRQLDNHLCLEVMERGWMTAGQMQILKQHYERLHAPHSWELLGGASLPLCPTRSACETCAHTPPSNSMAVY